MPHVIRSHWLPLLCALIAAMAFYLAFVAGVPARDLDGRYANNPLKYWFDALRSPGGGFCCSQADGKETEYDVRGDKYWVPVNGTWTEVPDDRVITEPNKFGRPMVWLNSQDQIRCFIPGAGL